MRLEVLTKAGMYGCPDVMSEARKRFTVRRKEGTLMHVSIRKLVFMIIGGNATDEEYDFMFEAFKNGGGSDQSRLQSGLSQTRNEKQIKKYLEFALSENVRSQDTVKWFVGISVTTVGRQMAWNFFKEHFAEFKKRYAESKSAGDILHGIASGFSSMDKYKEVDDFIKKVLACSHNVLSLMPFLSRTRSQEAKSSCRRHSTRFN